MALDGRASRHLVALHDAEAVLLVDHDHGEVGKGDVALDQGVRAHHDRGVARGDAAERRPALGGRQAAGQQLAGHERPEQRGHRLEVLLGERLGGRHEGALMALLHRPQQRVHGDHGLAGADVSLQQPAHGPVALEVGVDLGDRPHLVIGERKGQAGQELRSGLARRAERRSAAGLLLGVLVEQQAELHEKELLEDEALARRGGLGVRAGRVDGKDGVGLGRQALGGAQPARQRVRQAARRPAHLVDEIAQDTRRDALARRVDGHDALGVDGLPLAGQDLVRLDGKRGPAAAQPHAAAQAEHHARLEHLGQPGLVEPDADHHAGLVAQHGLEDGDAAPMAVLESDALHGRPDRRLLADLEVGDRLAIGEVLVAARVVREQVADGRQAKAGEPLGQDGPHPRQIGQRPGEL